MHECRWTAKALTRGPRYAERQLHFQHPKTQRGIVELTLGAEFKDAVEKQRAEVPRQLVVVQIYEYQIS
jgi:hypothetical protein